MAKISLENITSGFNLQKINANFQKIQSTLQNKVYYRDNPFGEPNSLLTDMDVNGRAIYNLPEPTVASQAARLQDVQNAIGNQATANLTAFTPSGTISATNVQGAIQELDGDVTNLASSITGITAFSQTNTYGGGTLGKKAKDRIGIKDSPFSAEGVGTDDTSKIQSAATYAGNSGLGKQVLEIPKGDYYVSAPSITPAVVVGSDTQVLGIGGRIRALMQDFYMLWSSGKGGIRYEGLTLSADATSNTNDAQAAIYAEPGDAICLDLSVTNTSLVNTSWGALFRADAGTGLFANLRYIGNSVISTVTGEKSDGLHMVGRNYNMAIGNNTVIGRGDAAIAMNMVASHQGANFSITGNALLDNLVGVDISGGQYGVVSGNACWSAYATNKSNPAMRFITYTGSIPKYVVANGNLAFSNHTLNFENDIKVDSAGNDTHISITANMTKYIYTNARYNNISGNHLLDGGGIFVDNFAGEIFIGQNTFEGALNITGQGNAGLAGNVYVANQLWASGNPANFLPNYPAANPFWANQWKFKSDVRAITTAPFAAAADASAPADVTNGVFVLDRPCIVDSIIGLADLATHTGHVVICDMSNVELVRATFSTLPGTGGTNVQCTLTGPTQAGNVYKAKLLPGVYKVRVFSDIVTSTTTLKNLAIAAWWG